MIHCDQYIGHCILRKDFRRYLGKELLFHCSPVGHSLRGLTYRNQQLDMWTYSYTLQGLEWRSQKNKRKWNNSHHWRSTSTTNGLLEEKHHHRNQRQQTWKNNQWGILALRFWIEMWGQSQCGFQRIVFRQCLYARHTLQKET